MKRPGFTARLRLLPAAIFVAGALLSVKLGSAWQGLELALTAPTHAQVQAPAGGNAQNEAKPSPPPGDAPRTAPSAIGSNAQPITEEEIAILSKLSARREELDRREREIELNQNVLAAAEKRLDAKLAELKKIQATVAGLIKKHDDEEEAKLRSLVKMYETMKPREAATIFERLDMPVLLDVVERMREQKSGAIVAKMDPEKAEKLTAALAERRALPKTAP